jgi:hypothetical protein
LPDQFLLRGTLWVESNKFRFVDYVRLLETF